MTEHVLIVNAGVLRPNGEGGRLNETMTKIAREAFEMAGFSVETTDLRQDWTLEEETDKVARAKLLLVQTPIWAMSTPWQYTRWQDEVLTHPKVCGTGGFLTDHYYWLSTTWNAPLEAINEPGQFFDGRGLEGVLMPLHKQFAYMGIRPFLPSFAVTDVYKHPTVEADIARWRETVVEAAKRLAELTQK